MQPSMIFLTRNKRASKESPIDKWMVFGLLFWMMIGIEAIS